MSDHVSWVLEFSIKPGEADTFKTLVDEMVEATRANEPDTLIYEWALGADGQTGHVCERYASSAAAMTHLASFGANFADRLLAAVDPTRLTIHGDPSAEVRDVLDGFGAIYMTPAAGFAR